MEVESNIPSEYTFGIKLIILLYAIVPFIPSLEAVDPIGTQWLYLGIINMGSLYLAYKINSNKFLNTAIGKHPFIYGFIAIIILSVFSLISAINLNEGIRVLSRVLTTFIGVITVSYFFQVQVKLISTWLIKVLIVIAFLISIQVVFHFVSNWGTPRYTKLLAGAKLLFGNRNITSATLVILMSFCLFGITIFKKKWYYFSYVTLFLCTTAILYIGSRTGLVSSVIILLLFVGLSVLKGRDHDHPTLYNKNRFIPFIVVIVGSLLLVFNSNRINKDHSNSLSNIISTANEQSSLQTGGVSNPNVTSNVRMLYYKMALNDIKSKPLLGVGLGNWKLANKDLYFEKSTRDKYVYPARTHNDFLQMAAETGVIGGLLYILLFLYSGYLLMRGVMRTKEYEKRWIFSTLIFALIGFAIDSTLNFPLERAPIQALLIFIFALTLALVVKKDTVRSLHLIKGNSLKIVCLAILNLGIICILYSNFKMLVAENYILADTRSKDLLTSSYTYKYQEAKGKLSNIFDITAGGKPVDHFLALYAMSDGNNDLALNHLDKSIKIAPNHYESKGLKAIIYGQQKKNLDSAIYYAKEGFAKYPAIKNNYVVLLNAYKEQNDTTSYFRTYDSWLEKFPNDVSQWKAKAESQFEFYKDETLVLKTLNSAIRLNPDENSLVQFREKYVSKSRQEDINKWYKSGFEFIKKKEFVRAKQEFLKILNVTPTNSATLLNLGIIEIKMKQYEEAVTHLSTIIEAKNFKDGRPEYNRGLAYEKLGNLEMAKRDFTRSKQLGYKLAQKLPKSKLLE